MLKKFLVFSFVSLCLSSQLLNADDSAASPLQQTQDCLRNQNCMSATTDAGKSADANALSAMGGDSSKKQALYDLSADIMPSLEQQAGGDPEKMQALLLKAQSDPAAFLNSLPPELQAKIKNAAVTLK